MYERFSRRWTQTSTTIENHNKRCKYLFTAPKSCRVIILWAGGCSAWPVAVAPVLVVRDEKWRVQCLAHTHARASWPRSLVAGAASRPRWWCRRWTRRGGSPGWWGRGPCGCARTCRSASRDTGSSSRRTRRRSQSARSLHRKQTQL